MEENEMKLELLPVDILKVMEDSLDIVAVEAERKNIELILDVEPSMPQFLIGDGVRIRQVLVNLLSNAIKFTESGEVHLTAYSKNPMEGPQCEFEFSVKDSGIGIHESIKKTLFQPFTQGDTSITRKFGGNGLGLTITKMLVELMGGTIRYESNRNEGTTFFVTLKAKKGSIPQSNIFKTCSSWFGKRILIIAFNSRLLCSLEKYFKALGFTTITSSSPDVSIDGFIDVGIVELPSTCHHSIRPLNCYRNLLEHLVQSGTSIITTGVKCANFDFPHLKKPLKLSALASAIRRVLKDECAAVPLPVAQPIHNTSIKILVVEDNAVNQRVIVKLLQSIGYNNLDIVVNGLEAVNAVATKVYDVILMDIMMPIMGGVEATQIIRKNLPANQQPTIFALTANAFQEDKQKFAEAGMDATITKPINKNELLAYLGMSIKKKQLNQCQKYCKENNLKKCTALPTT